MKWRIVLVPFAFLVVGLSRLLSPLVIIRFGEVWSDRLGHLVGNTECYLTQKGKTFDIWHFKKVVANRVIADKYKAVLHTWPHWFGSLVILINRFFKGWERHVAQSDNFDRDIYNLWKKPHIGFTAEEKKQGRQLLKDLGIPCDARWVCLIVRDSAYLKDMGDYSYHDYRDADVNDYIQAAVSIANSGRYVLRMGVKVSKPLPRLHPRIIDYASSPLRSEFGDLYLGAKCEFCIGTSTGFMVIPQVFKRPCAVTDFVPIEYISTFCRDRIIWKHHIKDGREMTFEEIIESGAGQFMKSEDFRLAGITLENNSPEEIKELAMEMLTGQTGDQKDFWDRFPRSISPYSNKPIHGKMLARIGRKFLARVQSHSKAGHQGSEPRKTATV